MSQKERPALVLRVANLASLAIGILPITLQALGTTADWLELLGSGITVVTALVLVGANVALFLIVSRSEKSAQGQQGIPAYRASDPKRTRSRREERKIIENYQMITKFLLLIIVGLVIVTALVYFQKEPAREQAQILAEHQEEAEIKEEATAADLYNPLTPPSGSYVSYWESFDPDEVQIGELPEGIIVASGIAQVVRDPEDPENLALQVSAGDTASIVMFPANFGNVANRVQQRRERYESFGAYPLELLSGIPFFELMSDGEWHTDERRFIHGDLVAHSLDGMNFPLTEVTQDQTVMREVYIPDGYSAFSFDPYSTILLDDLIWWEEWG